MLRFCIPSVALLVAPLFVGCGMPSSPDASHDASESRLADGGGYSAEPLLIQGIQVQGQEALPWGGQRVFLKLVASERTYWGWSTVENEFQGVSVERASSDGVLVFMHLAVTEGNLVGAPTLNDLRQGVRLSPLGTLASQETPVLNSGLAWEALRVKTRLPWYIRIISGGRYENSSFVDLLIKRQR